MQWKTGGDEDKFLQKLIKKGKITKSTKPASLKADYPLIFADFTPNVIRNHLTLVKRAHGMYCK